MPAATHYAPDDRVLRAAADAERRERQQIHERNWRYYRGDHPQPLDPQRGDDNVTLNLCRQVIDRTVAFLVPDFPTLELDDPAVDSPAENWLRAAWQANQGAVTLATLALNGALDGHVYARIVPARPFPRILALNSAHLITFWDADDFSRVLWYELSWQVGRTVYRQDVVKDGRRWLIRDFVRQANRWVLEREEVWPFSDGPIVAWQHQIHPTRFYGRHELPHARLNDLINKVASDTARILRFHAFPRTVGTGFEAENVQSSGIDDFWVIPEKDARVYNLEMQSDLAASLHFLQLLTDHFLAESRVTMLNGDPQHFKGVTNLGVRVAYLDQIAKTEMLRRQYTQGIQALSRSMLALSGEYPPVTPTVHWGEPLPVDRREAVELAARQIELGLLSPQHAAAQLGLDWEAEQARQTTDS